MVWPACVSIDSGAAPSVFPGLLTLLRFGSFVRIAVDRRAAERNFGIGNSSDAYIGWLHGDGLPQAQPISPYGRE